MKTLSRAQSICFSVIIGLVIVVADQLTKWLIVQYLPPHGISVIPGFFDLVLAYNPGAAFGIFGGFAPALRYALLGIASCLAIGAILILVIRSFAQSRLALTALGAICGGAVGNLIDRFRLGVVVDFLDVYWGQYHWPAFNVADSAICVGVMILLLLKPKTVAVRAVESSNGSPV